MDLIRNNIFARHRCSLEEGNGMLSVLCLQINPIRAVSSGRGSVVSILSSKSDLRYNWLIVSDRAVHRDGSRVSWSKGMCCRCVTIHCRETAMNGNRDLSSEWDRGRVQDTRASETSRSSWRDNLHLCSSSDVKQADA